MNILFRTMTSIACFFVFFISGCTNQSTTVVGSWGAADYKSVIQEAEKNKSFYDTVGPYGHVVTCDSYLQLRHFKKFNTCMKSLAKYQEYNGEEYHSAMNRDSNSVIRTITGGDRVHSNSKIQTQRDNAQLAIYKAFFLLMQAEEAFALGDVEKAHQLSKASFKIAERGGAYGVKHKVLLRSLGLAAYTCNFTKSCQRDNRYLTMLNGLYIQQLDSLGRRDKNLLTMWLMRSNLQAGKYQENIKLYNDIEGTTGFEKTMLVMTYLNPLQYIILGSASIMTGTNMFKHINQEFTQASDEELAQYYLQKSYMGVGKYDKAFDVQQQLISEMKDASISSITYSLLSDHATILLQRGERDKAIAMLKSAVDIIEQQRQSVSSENGRIGFLGDKQAVYANLIDTLIEQGDITTAFEYVERSKSRALIDMLVQRIDVPVSANDEQYISGDAFKFESAGGDTRGIKLVRNKGGASKGEEKRLVTIGQQLSYKQLSRELKEGETYVEFYGYADKWYSFVFSTNGVDVLPINVDALKEVVIFRRLLKGDNITKSKMVAKQLYTQLIKPLESHLKTKNLTIIPHGVLHYLPFSALYDGRKYLVDRFNIRMLPSASVLPYLAKPKEKQNKLLALGNPYLGDEELSLPYAETEVKEISSLVKGSDIYVEKQATESKVKNSAKKYSILHFASHGVFNSIVPLDSALLLAKDKSNDGALTVRELYDMDINADLVTLSACETALGHIDNGDDVIGFTRGFMFAGANSIVSSLWTVDDEATYKLMTYFYKNLQNMNKRDALAAAQRKLKTDYPNPYYWSAFQLSGMAL